MAMRPNPQEAFQEQGWVGKFSLFPEKYSKKKNLKKEKEDLAPLLWGHTDVAGAVQPEKEKTPGRP